MSGSRPKPGSRAVTAGAFSLRPSLSRTKTPLGRPAQKAVLTELACASHYQCSLDDESWEPIRVSSPNSALRDLLLPLKKHVNDILGSATLEPPPSVAMKTQHHSTLCNDNTHLFHCLRYLEGQG